MILEEKNSEAKKLSSAKATPLITPRRKGCILFLFLIFLFEEPKKATKARRRTEDETNNHQPRLGME
jgi:hypothetical protein